MLVVQLRLRRRGPRLINIEGRGYLLLYYCVQYLIRKEILWIVGYKTQNIIMEYGQNRAREKETTDKDDIQHGFVQCNAIFQYSLIHCIPSKHKIINKYYAIALPFTLYGTFFSSIIHL